MGNVLWIVIGILLLIVLALMTKVYVLRRDVRKIVETFRERLTTDTNTLIDSATRDPDIRKLAAEMNVQLRLLRKERHRYQQGDRALKEAVTNISHDLRTPLTAIRGYLELLEREENSEAGRRYLSQIQNRTEALTALTEEFFQYSVATSNHALQPERIDLVRVLEKSLLSFYAAMQGRGISPQIELPEEAVWRCLDPGAVERVFANIVSNAIKYSDGDLDVTMGKDGSIIFANSAEKLNAVTIGRLFDRFYTVEAGRNSAGLGLAIARTLTERMGGSLEALYSGGRLELRLKFEENSQKDIM